MSGPQDFDQRAHSLWRMRVAHWQHRARYFWGLVLAMTGGGAMVAAQLALPAYIWPIAWQCLFARFLVSLGSMVGKDLKMNVGYGGHQATFLAKTVASDPLWVQQYDRVLNTLAVGALLGLLAGLVVTWGIRRAMTRQGVATFGDRVLGGTQVVGAAALAARVQPLAGAGALCIGPVPVPRRIETRHFAFLGTTGSGKTTVLRQMLDGIEARGEAALVYDTSGEFIAHYYRPQRGDVISIPLMRAARTGPRSTKSRIPPTPTASRVSSSLRPAARTTMCGWRPAASLSPTCSVRSGRKANAPWRRCSKPCRSNRKSS